MPTRLRLCGHRGVEDSAHAQAVLPVASPSFGSPQNPLRPKERVLVQLPLGIPRRQLAAVALAFC